MTYPYRVTKTRRLGRYLSGRPLGVPKTNATFLRPADLILDPGGRAGPWSRMAGWKRTVVRLSPGAVAAGAIGHLVAPVTADITAGTIGAAGAAYGLHKARRFRARRRVYRQVIRPLTLALEPIVGMPASAIEARLIVPDSTDQPGRVPLPDHFAGRQAEVADIVRVFTQRVGGEWDSALQLRSSPFYLALAPRPAPPGELLFAQVRDLCLATSQDRPLLGLGARSDPIYLDFTGEIAHLAASIGTGGGKSSFLRFLVAQFAHHGVRDFDVCDVKWVSLQGMEAVPGLRIHRDVEDIWDALGLARAEMDLRYRRLLADPHRTFPRKVILLEEQNAFALESAIRWREVRPKGDKRATAPVWNDIALLLVKARQVNMNLIGVYQRMSAEASGGGTYRDQYGLKLLSRFSPQAWDTLVGTRPRGTSSAVPGRAIAVLGGQIRAVQMPLITVEQALAFATSGPAVGLSSAGGMRDIPSGQSTAGTRTEPQVTIREAIDQGLIEGNAAAWTKRLQRDEHAPAPVGQAGNARLYRQDQLAGWASQYDKQEVR